MGKKILIEGMTENKGGKETFIINIFNELKDRGYDFSFVEYEKPMVGRDYLIENGATIYNLPERKNGYRRFCKALENLFSENEFDVVWAHKVTLSSCEFLKIATKHGIKTRIVHSHSSDNMGGKFTMFMHKRNRKKIEAYANHFLACSESASKWFFGDKKALIVKNAIDASKFKYNEETRDRIRKELGFEGAKVVGHIGRLSKEKNHKKLIDVFAKLKGKHDEYRLCLCGDGPMREEIENQIKDLGLEDSVKMMGVVENANEMMQAFDVFVMPSLFEGLPFALVEAESSGLKCVVSDTVSKESDIAGWNTFIPLDADDEIWAGEVQEAAKEHDRIKGFEIIKEQGYDIKKQVKLLEDLLKN